jgi:hypothetical protein
MALINAEFVDCNSCCLNGFGDPSPLGLQLCVQMEIYIPSEVSYKIEVSKSFKIEDPLMSLEEIRKRYGGHNKIYYSTQDFDDISLDLYDREKNNEEHLELVLLYRNS